MKWFAADCLLLVMVGTAIGVEVVNQKGTEDVADSFSTYF